MKRVRAFESIDGRWNMIGQIMRRRILLALFVFVITCMSGLAAYHTLAEPSAAAQIINEQGRQRMLALRIALDAQRLLDPMEDRSMLVSEIQSDLALMHVHMDNLTAAVPEIFGSEPKPEIRQLMADLTNNFAVLDTLAQGVVSWAKNAPTAGSLGLTTSAYQLDSVARDGIIVDLDALVRELERAAANQSKAFQQAILASTGLLLLVVWLTATRNLLPLTRDVEDAVEQLSEVKRFHKTILEHIPACVIVISADRIVHVNTCARHLFALAVDDNLERVEDALPSVDLQQTGSRQPVEIDDPETGQKLYMEARVQRIDEQRIIHITDRTEVTETKARINSFYKALDAVPVNVLITSASGHIEFANRHFTEVTGHAVSDLIGRTPAVVQSGQTSSDTYQLLWETIRSGRQWKGEILNKKKDGTTFWAYQAITPLQNAEGKTIRFFSVSQDITQLKDKEKSLRQALKQAEEASQTKSAFLATMSHELRTPLNAIIGYSELLLAGIGGQITDKQTEYLTAVHESGDRLLCLINDLLDLSKIEAGMMTLEEEESEVVDLVKSTISLMSASAEQKRVSLLANIPSSIPAVLVDAFRIEQVLVNLLSNALRFSPEGSTIEVTAEQTADSIRISVSDAGPGINPAALTEIFRPFGQIKDAMKREREGTGLGLPICKEIMDLHDGTIAVEPSSQGGAKVSLNLPKNRVLDHDRNLMLPESAA